MVRPQPRQPLLQHLDAELHDFNLHFGSGARASQGWVTYCCCWRRLSGAGCTALPAAPAADGKAESASTGVVAPDLHVGIVICAVGKRDVVGALLARFPRVVAVACSGSRTRHACRQALSNAGFRVFVLCCHWKPDSICHWKPDSMIASRENTHLTCLSDKSQVPPHRACQRW